MNLGPGFEAPPSTTIGNYRLERMLSRDELGPVYIAHDASGASFRLRVLPVRAEPTLHTADSFVVRLQQQAQHLALLQHPQIPPLVDFGIYRGNPYLVWPHQPLRSLSGVLAESGPLDPATVGRYLDQIADALDYAHAHDTLHRNLSTDCVYLSLEGRPVVADFGVRRIFELAATEQERAALAGASDACAPEQVLGGRVYLYTDVYALGALVYRLLTGVPVFTGETREDVAQQHVYAQVPPLRARRSGLSPAFDAMMAHALAKSPEQRYQHVGELTQAYTYILQALGSSAASTGGPATQAQPPSFSAPEVQRADRRQDRLSGNPPGRRYGGRSGATSTSKRSLGRIVATAALLFVLVSGGIFILGGKVGSGGTPLLPSATVAFLDATGETPGDSDTAQIVAHGLSAPTVGHHYYAWMVDTANEAITALGVLSASGGTFSVIGPVRATSTGASKNLLGSGDKVEITLENGTVTVPTGRVVLIGTFPPKTFVHIMHLLVSYPDTPGQIGLLVGVLRQTQLLSTEADILQNAVSEGTIAVGCGAHSLIDIIEGSHGPDYQTLQAGCAKYGITSQGQGDGFGLLGASNNGYIDAASQHASLAATQPDATDAIRLHAGHVQIALANVKGWVTTLRSDALKLLQSPQNTSLVAQIVTLSDQAYHGVSPNTDQQPGPVAGQGGAITAYEHGQFMATLTLS